MKTFLSALTLILLVQSGLFGQELHTRQAPLPCLNKKLTVVVHIVRDSFGAANIQEEEILANFDSLNNHFSPICVSFEVCDIRYIPNFQYDTLTREEWEEIQVKYHLANRINVFYVAAGFWDAVECGYASQEGITGSLDTGGIIIQKSCLEGQPESKDLAHQMGHYFGLYNTNERDMFGQEVFARDDCDTTGDLFCDTPADPYITGQPLPAYINVAEGCRFIFNGLDPNGQYYIPDVGNLMSLYPDECRCGYSYEQFVRLAEKCEEAAGQLW